MTNTRFAPPFHTVDAATILRLAGRNGLAVVAPHPDDETLGCGALIAQAARSGCAVTVIAITAGDASHPGSQRWPPSALGKLRLGELRNALARLGARDARVRLLGARDGDVAGSLSAVRLRACLAALRPGIVLVTSPKDHHLDHRAAARITVETASSLGIPAAFYEVWARSGATRRQASPWKAAKRWAMAAHRSQMGDYIDDAPEGFYLSAAVLASLVGGVERYQLCRNLGVRALPRRDRGRRDGLVPLPRS